MALHAVLWATPRYHRPAVDNLAWFKVLNHVTVTTPSTRRLYRESPFLIFHESSLPGGRNGMPAYTLSRAAVVAAGLHFGYFKYDNVTVTRSRT